MLERGHTIAVAQIYVRLGLNQQVDDFLVTLAAIAEDNSLQQRGPTEVVDVVDTDAGLDQRADLST